MGEEGQVRETIAGGGLSRGDAMGDVRGVRRCMGVGGRDMIPPGDGVRRIPWSVPAGISPTSKQTSQGFLSVRAPGMAVGTFNTGPTTEVEGWAGKTASDSIVPAG